MKQSIWADICEFCVKNIVWIAVLSIGSMVKIMVDNRIKKLTMTQKIVKFIISFFCGAIVAWFFVSTGNPQKAIWVTPLATLGGDGLITWLSQNGNKVWNTLFKKYFGDKTTDNDSPTT